MQPNEILAWLKASKASLYYLEAQKMWVCADGVRSRMGDTLEEAVEQVAYILERDAARMRQARQKEAA